jgi:hypothetical protein
MSNTERKSSPADAEVARKGGVVLLAVGVPLLLLSTIDPRFLAAGKFFTILGGVGVGYSWLRNSTRSKMSSA